MHKTRRVVDFWSSCCSAKRAEYAARRSSLCSSVFIENKDDDEGLGVFYINIFISDLKNPHFLLCDEHRIEKRGRLRVATLVVSAKPVRKPKNPNLEGNPRHSSLMLTPFFLRFSRISRRSRILRLPRRSFTSWIGRSICQEFTNSGYVFTIFET